MTYDEDPTKVTTTAAEAFALKRGVCQDLTHIFIAAARSLAIPARYIGGRFHRADGETRAGGRPRLGGGLRSEPRLGGVRSSERALRHRCACARRLRPRLSRSRARARLPRRRHRRRPRSGCVLHMHDAEAVRLELLSAAGQAHAVRWMNVVQQHDAAALGLQPRDARLDDVPARLIRHQSSAGTSALQAISATARRA